ncbi:MAG: hypothetical protein H7235_07325 [Bdellovibrionaceae bacterium]|nr:hypothetical protein [Pseudobdellovibrionaceae bacterium]
MKLFKLLELHKTHSTPGSIQNNFGDGFLCQNNKIYATIRDHATKLGFTCSEENNLHAMVLPFAHLEQIFTTKKIPMMNNVSVFEALGNKALQEIEWVEVEMGYKRNYLFHESCHVVARDILEKSNVENKILSLLLEESFANASELFAMTLAEEEGHQIFFSANSYTIAFEDADRLNQIVKKFGFDKSFQFTLLAYLHSNLLYPTYTDKDFKALTKFIFKKELTQPEAQQIGFLAEMAFSLDEGFKYATRGLHFKLNNYSEADFNQIKKSYLSTLLASANTANMLDTMVKVFYI